MVITVYSNAENALENYTSLNAQFTSLALIRLLITQLPSSTPGQLYMSLTAPQALHAA